MSANPQDPATPVVSSPSSSADTTLVAQVILTTICLVTCCYLWATGQTPPSELVLLTTGLVMYFFGGRAPASGVRQMASAMQHFTLSLPV